MRLASLACALALSAAGLVAQDQPLKWTADAWSGVRPREGVTVAADWRVWPKGTRLYVEGVGLRVVQDTGDDIEGQSLDVFVADHGRARAHGSGVRRVRVLR